MTFSPEPFTHCMFKSRRGAFVLILAGLLATGASSFDVSDLAVEGRDVHFHVTVAGLEVVRVGPGTCRLALVPVDARPLRAAGHHFYPSYLVVQEGDDVQEGRIVGHWSPAGQGAWESHAFLPPGDYWATVWDPGLGEEIVSLQPITITKGSRATLALDLGTRRRFSVVPRQLGGGGASDRATEGKLVLCGNTYPMAPWVERPNWRAGAEAPSQAVIRTFGGIPTEALLAQSPGANGQKVRIRPVSEAEDLPGADLVVEVPAWADLQVELKPAANGRVHGFSDSSPPGLESISAFSSAGPGRSGPVLAPTVRHDRNATLWVTVRGEVATGVVLEKAEPYGTMVRDWFVASESTLSLLGNGGGHPVEVVSPLDEACTLVWRPKDPDGAGLRSVRAGHVAPGGRLLLWVPEAAAELVWYRQADLDVHAYWPAQPWTGRKPLGQTRSISGPSIALK